MRAEPPPIVFSSNQADSGRPLQSTTHAASTRNPHIESAVPAVARIHPLSKLYRALLFLARARPGTRHRKSGGASSPGEHARQRSVEAGPHGTGVLFRGRKGFESPGVPGV